MLTSFIPHPFVGFVLQPFAFRNDILIYGGCNVCCGLSFGSHLVLKL